MRFKAIALAISALILSFVYAPVTAGASSVQWIPVGPSGPHIGSGKVNAFAFVQSNPKVMYVGGGWGNTPRESPSQMGIFGTTDGGATWTPLDNGLTNTDGTISSVVNGLWLDQANPSVLLAATEFGGTFRSTNGGTTWTNVSRSESTQFATNGSSLYVATRKGILVSTNDGATWTVSLRAAKGASTVVTGGTATYAGLTNGDVYRLNGTTWTKTGHPGNGPVHNLAVDPFNASIVYANVDDASAWNQNLYGSINGGVTWTFINCNCSIGAQALAASLVVPHRMYLGDDGGGVIYYFTADGNPNPTLHFGAQPFGVDMRYIVPAKATVNTDDACYLLEDQGLFYAARCTTGTAPPLNANTPDTLAYDVKVTSNGMNAIVPLQDNSGALSTDGGKHWTYPNSAANAGEGGEAFVDPANTAHCYFTHPDSGLWISSNGCATTNGTGESGFESIAFDPTHSGKLYGIDNADTNSARTVVSTNSGSSWNATSFHFANPYQVVVSTTDANTILVAYGTTTGAPHLSYSHDGGASFHAATGLPTQALPNITLYFPVNRFFAAFEPGVAGTILLADHDPLTDNVLIYRSTDNGVSFSLVQTFTQPVPSRPWPHLAFPTSHERAPRSIPYYATRFFGNRVSFNPNPPTGVTPAVIVTTRFGAYASFDAGTTWARIDTAAIAHHFVGISWSKGYAYLASFGEGVVRSKTPLQ
jgi:hypothetical protein